jgi:hypothetical protein
VPLKWTSGMRRGEQPLGVMDNLLFSLRSLLGGSYPETCAQRTAEGLICLSILTEGRKLVPFVGALCTLLVLRVP